MGFGGRAQRISYSLLLILWHIEVLCGEPHSDSISKRDKLMSVYRKVESCNRRSNYVPTFPESTDIGLLLAFGDVLELHQSIAVRILRADVPDPLVS